MCQFLVLAITTGKKKVPVVCLAGCAVVSVFGSGGKLAVFLLWRESFFTTGKKSSSRLSGRLCCCVSFWFWRLRPEKKSSSRLSGGLCCCVSFWFWREIGSFLLWQESFVTTGKKKFQSFVWRVVLLCKFLVLAITTGKKSSCCLSGGLVLSITTGKKSSSRLSGGLSVFGSGDYDQKKKVQSSLNLY